MPFNYKKYFRDDRKYFTIVFFIVLSIIISGIFTPIYINYKRTHWDEELKQRIVNIEASVKKLHSGKENYLLDLSGRIRKKLKHVLSAHNTSYGKLIEAVNKKEYSEVSVEVVAPNGKIIAWNGNPAVPQEEIFPLYFPAGETYFYNSGLFTYLSVLDTLTLDADQFYFIVSLPYEKKYTIQNEYYREVSFINSISARHMTQFEIDFTPYAAKTKDGRKYSFELLNNKNNKIALVTFFKPAVTVTQNNIYNDVSLLQTFLALLAFVMTGMGFRKEYRELKNSFLKLILFSIYFAGLRVVLFLTDIPSRIMEGALTDPANFSSAFGWGIVKSPVDFFLTVLIFLLISIRSFSFLTSYINRGSSRRNKSVILFIAAAITGAFAFFVTLRGFSASLRSVIFDSSLRYFRGAEIIPEMPVLFMLTGVLMLALAVVLFLASYLVLIFRLIPGADKKQFRIYSVSVLIIFLITGLIYIVTQPNPLISLFIALLFMTIIWIYIYQVYDSRIGSVFNYVYASLIGSALSISLLNAFNVELELETLKTTAAEINRPDENLIKFLISEALISSAQDTEIQQLFTRRYNNYDAAAFTIWSRSALEREAVNSAVILYNPDRQERGRFTVGLKDEPDSAALFGSINGSAPGILKLPGKETGTEYYAGIIPVIDQDFISGYIGAIVEYDADNPFVPRVPDFLQSGKKTISSVVDPAKLNIFRFRNMKVIGVSGDLYPSLDQIKAITAAVDNESGEAWMTINFNNEQYKAYVQQVNDQVTAVALKEIHFSWRLFNFFKIFILHSLIILLLYIILYAFTVRGIKYTFRTQLLIAFLVISIFPVLFLAFYNRQVVNERSTGEVLNELSERAEYLQNHFSFQLRKHPERSYSEVFKNAGDELGISFSVYDNSNLFYSSAAPYYNAGLLPSKLNPEAYYNLNYLNYREYVAEEKLDSYAYNSFYRKIALQDKGYVLCVNDAFNRLDASLGTADFDIFLFGVYSFAVLIIIIISTILADKISSPIRKLTSATGSVAHGDLNIRLANTERGEIRALIDGFNYMTEELKKNEAEMAMLERENAWKEMAKQVAHEIKNPLTPMKLAVQQMVISFRDRNKNFDELFEKVSSTLLSQIENLNQIASEFSRFARMPKFNVEEIDLLETIRDTANLFIDENIRIRINTPLEKAPCVSDKAQTRRMFINLIRNSIQAGASEVSIYLNNDNGNYIIRLEDNGKGIPEDSIEKIFEPGFTTKDKGMGLGLKITRRYIESLGGEISLTQTSPAGTAFRIQLPGSIL